MREEWVSTHATTDHTGIPGVGSGVPIGTVVDWWRATTATPVPTGFAIADGSVVADAASPFNGQALPNLHDQMIRGISAGQVATYGGDSGPPPTGGADTHGHGVNGHTHSMQNHTHVSYVHAHPIANDGAHFHNTHGTNVGSNEVFNGVGSLGAIEGAGLHDHLGTTALNAAGNSSGPSTNSTGSSGSSTDTQSNVPAYVGMLKIIRIK